MDEHLRQLELRAKASGSHQDWEAYRRASLRVGYCIECDNEGQVCSRCGSLRRCECLCYCCGSELLDCSGCSATRQNPDSSLRGAERAFQAHPTGENLLRFYREAQRAGLRLMFVYTSEGLAGLPPAPIVDVRTSEEIGGSFATIYPGTIWFKTFSTASELWDNLEGRNYNASRVYLEDASNRRNPDEQSRQTQRDFFAEGGIEAEARHLRNRMREGGLDPAFVRLAASLGSPAAQCVIGPGGYQAGERPTVSEVLEWLSGLGSSKTFIIGILADFVEHVLPNFELYFPQDDRPRLAVQATRAWVAFGYDCLDASRDAALAVIENRGSVPVSVAVAATNLANATYGNAPVTTWVHWIVDDTLRATDTPGLEADWQRQHLIGRLLA